MLALIDEYIHWYNHDRVCGGLSG
ncbi:integrase core domain-containing protein [Bifidobacterium breve]|uniref:Integrase core domain-containing protein n=1 Tax=Bifidobacterium breve TaxID=1685 RepID=A0AAW4U5T1_BIFBR|nr:integrase core domain-containing protein [Bifidobacterium breve]MCB8548859.1 integrase core domain-containing protein [Bifidobacterium sp. MSK23_125]MCB8555537.1 integrase core domain-containing protein [Bifidobacterium sp. MSK23_139]MCB5613665.1 integrase core domain-containing protein [Bifidobacterium breve]MCB5628188.1 integrase core domain-containing protein [Bifidobacterium breve]